MVFKQIEEICQKVAGLAAGKIGQAYFDDLVNVAIVGVLEKGQPAILNQKQVTAAAHNAIRTSLRRQWSIQKHEKQLAGSFDQFPAIDNECAEEIDERQMEYGEDRTQLLNRHKQDSAIRIIG